VVRLANRLDILDDTAVSITDHTPASRLAGEIRIPRQLDAFLSYVLDVGEADDVRDRLALRVVTLEFALLVDAGDAQRRDAFGDVGIDLSLEVQEAAVGGFGQLAPQIPLARLQQLRELGELSRVRLDLLRNR